MKIIDNILYRISKRLSAKLEKRRNLSNTLDRLRCYRYNNDPFCARRSAVVMADEYTEEDALNTAIDRLQIAQDRLKEGF